MTAESAARLPPLARALVVRHAGPVTDRPTSVEEYLAAFPDEARRRLTGLRALCLEAAPDAVEGLKWGYPAYWTGTILFMFSGHREHASVAVTPTALDAFRGELEALGHGTGKGSVRLPYDRPVPTELVARLLAHRAREYEVDGVTWR